MLTILRSSCGRTLLVVQSGLAVAKAAQNRHLVEQTYPQQRLPDINPGHIKVFVVSEPLVCIHSPGCLEQIWILSEFFKVSLSPIGVARLLWCSGTKLVWPGLILRIEAELSCGGLITTR